MNHDDCMTVRRNFCINDCLKAMDDKEAAVNLIKQLTELLILGGFSPDQMAKQSARSVEQCTNTRPVQPDKRADQAN